MKYIRLACILLIFLVFTFGCGVTKVVTKPVKWTVKGTYKATKAATKGAAKVGKGAVGVVTYPFRDDESE
jgi:hypothetical protein